MGRAERGRDGMGCKREERYIRLELNSKTLVYGRESVCNTACHGEESTPLCFEVSHHTYYPS